MKICALFVDLGGVVVINRAREIGELYEKSDGLTLEMTKNVFRFIQTAKRTEEEINRYLQSVNIDPDLWKRFTKEFYSSEIKNDNLVKLLSDLKEKGLLIIFTTNNSDAVMKGMQKYEIENLPNLVINSSELQVAKPDKAFWEAAFKGTKELLPDLTLEEVLVIDDSNTNCVSAKEFGFQTYQYKNTPEAQTEISTLIS
ncbi:MAG: HAD hydrolase-like protein [Candidatus Shapirobacteria bacterium]